MDTSSPPLVHHLAVVVEDLTRAEGFWIDVVGLPLLTRHEAPDGSHRATWVGLGGGAFLALERASEPRPRRDGEPGWHCVALRIAPGEREALRARFEAAGFPVFRESPYTLYVRDPEGAVVAFSHHPEPADV